MEAIKKKMQAMKVEKDNLMDRCDNCEQVANLSFQPLHPTDYVNSFLTFLSGKLP